MESTNVNQRDSGSSAIALISFPSSQYAQRDSGLTVNVTSRLHEKWTGELTSVG